MNSNKKIVIIEDSYVHFEIYHSIVGQGNVVFPALNATDNQLFIAQVKAFVLTSDIVRKTEKKTSLKELFLKKLGGPPDVFIIDWNLYEKEGDFAGREFKDKFVEENYPDALVIEISQFIGENSVSHGGKRIKINKYRNGTARENIENYLKKEFKNIL